MLRGLVAASVLGAGTLVVVAGPAAAIPGCSYTVPALGVLVTCTAGSVAELSSITVPAGASKLAFTVNGSGGSGVVAAAGVGGRGATVTGVMPVPGPERHPRSR